MFPILQIGPVALPLPELIVLVGIWIGIYFAEKHAVINGSDANNISNLIIYSLLLGLLGARLGYVFQYLDYFISDPIGIFSRNLSLFDPIIGYFSAGLTMVIFIQRKKMDFWRTLDAITPFFALLVISLSLSHLASGSSIGTPTNAPWGIEIWGIERHPVPLYELISSIFIFVLIYPGKGILWSLKSGITSLRFFLLTTTAIIMISSFRGDLAMTAFGIKTNQLIAWIMLLFILVLLSWRQQKTSLSKVKEITENT
jgi:phosphatidylglycerol:prolipoprotein diacylglycerol transferase